MQSKNHTFKYFILYFSIFYGLGVFLPYINVYLEKVHFFNGYQIGQINAISVLFGITFTPIFGIICDKTNRHKHILLLILSMLLLLLQFYRNATSFAIILLIAVLFELFRTSLLPISDLISSEFAEKNHVPFGTIRTFGSLGYMLGSIITGIFLESIGYDGMIFTSFSIALIIAITSLIFIPNQSKKQPAFKLNFSSIIKNKKFYVLLLYVVTTTTLIDATSSYIGNHLIITLKAESYYISLYTLFMVLPEILVLPFALRLINYFGQRKYYILSAILVFIRLFVTGITNSPVIVILMPIFHFTSLVAATVGNITFLRKTFKKEELAMVFTLFSACAGLIRAGYNMFFGMIYQQLGSNIVFLISASLVIVGLIIFYYNNIFD